MVSASLVMTGPAAPVLKQNGHGLPLGLLPNSALVAIAQTADTIPGNANTTISAPNAAIVAGVQIIFGSQPAAIYVVRANVAGVLTLDRPYSGAGAGADPITNATPVVVMPPTLGNTDATVPRQYQLTKVNGERIQLNAAPWGTFPGVNGNPGTGFACTSPATGIFDCVGADRQPVQLAVVAASTLTF